MHKPHHHHDGKLHEPVPYSVAASLGHPKCAWVTGGPKEYLPGLNCMGRRLEALGSKYPLLTMVEPEEEHFMRKHVILNSHPSSAVIPWKRFPDPQNRSNGWRYRSAHVLDKMNLFGMPFRRLVWLDADVFLRRNVDEICELPDDVELATALDAEGKPTHCWPSRRLCPATCGYDLRNDAKHYVAKRPDELQPHPDKCQFILQSGVMMLKPFNLTAYNALIVEPVSRGLVATYDSGDQGLITTMMYSSKHRLFGDRYMRLHPSYNVIARHAKHTEMKWGGGLPNNLTAALLHFTRETRPWQNAPQSNNVTRAAEWTFKCGPVVCKNLQVTKRKAASAVKNGTLSRDPIAVGVQAGWERTYCNLTFDPTSSHFAVTREQWGAPLTTAEGGILYSREAAVERVVDEVHAL